MNSKKINQLATELTPSLNDLTIIGDPSTGISKKITLSQMASLFTGTVEEYANLASFPLVGTADTIYIALDTNIIYRWNTGTSAYVELSPNIVTSLVFSDANGFDGTISLVGSTATLTITTALTTGSVGFIGASGALTQDNSNFFWDNTNKRLGINTNAPTTAIDAFGSGIIGRLNGTSTNNAFLGFANAGSNKWSIGNVQSDHRFRIYSEANAAELVSVLQTGEVGIGIANPLTKLHIFGGASALIANLDANTSVAKSISFRSGNSSRFNIEVSGTESGSNAGANFFIRRYSDAGALIDTPLTITRSTGVVTLASALPISSGGTGSTTQNFVDLTTTQSIGGAKTFTNSLIVATTSNTGFTIATNNTTGFSYIDLINNGAGGKNYQIGIAGNSATSGYANNLYFDLVGSGTIMTLTSSRNVGIGTSSPNTYTVAPQLVVDSGTSGGGLTIKTGTTSSTTNYGGVFFADGTTGSEQYRGFIQYNHNYNSLSDTLILGTAGSERMFITSSGNVGIGINSTNAKLYVLGNNEIFNVAGTNATSAYTGYYYNTDTLVGYIGNGSSILSGAASSDFIFRSQGALVYAAGGNSERMRIRSDGNVAIGNNGYSYIKFQIVAQDTSSSNYAINIDNSSNQTLFYVRNDGLINTGTRSGSPYNNTSGAAANMVVNSSGTLERATSSLKYKTDIVNYDKGLAEVLKMRPVYYKSINEREKDLRFAGLIAEEIEELGLTEFVQYAEDGTPDALAYSNMISLLTKAIQEQQAQIEELKALINK